MTPVMGTRMLRKEDPELLTGEKKYTDDLVIPGALWFALVRSPHAHARITSIDATEAKAMPGVIDVLTGKDLEAEWANPMPTAWPIPDGINPPHYPLTSHKARYVGDAVAVVIAESDAAARDAVDAVVVDWDPLPAVVDLEDALSDRVILHDDAGTNRAYTWELKPDEAAVERAFAEADHTVKERYIQQRLIAAAMEPRAVAVVPAPVGGEYTIYSATQIPHILRVMLGITNGMPEQKLRVIAPAVGGGFGSKLDTYAEEFIALALAKRLGKPVRWREERSEAGQATVQGRGQIQDIELAAAADGRVTAVRVKLLADMGAYQQLLTGGIPLLGAFIYHGCYDIPAYSFECTSVYTTKTPTDAYRGAGRPEATYAIERAMDVLAAKIGLDPAEIRRRNYIPSESFPYANATGALVFDSGNYAAALDKALDLVGYAELRKEQQQRRDAGETKHLGIGLSSYVEMCGLAPSRVLAALGGVAGGWEWGSVQVLPTGKVQVTTGTAPHGQGHETSWSMIVADKLQISPDDVEVIHSDTALSVLGMDTYGSRSLAVGGTAIAMAADKVLDKCRTIAAHQLEAAEDDLEFVDGAFRVKGSPDRALEFAAIAFEAFSAHNLPDGLEPNLHASVSWDPPNFTFPFGTHVCVVEVDEETGAVEIVKYVAVDDCGNQVNPLIVEGQVHGGIVQGVAQALFEEAVYDDDGNLLTATLTDYLVPSAAEFPNFVTDHTVTPSPTNPMGVKGIGEAGTIASTPAVINAVVDALTHLGVTEMRMPASPMQVWSTIQAAKGAAK